MDITGLGSIADLASTVVNKIWPDKTQAEKDKMALALAQMNNELQQMTAQTDINKVEAGSNSLFVAGWRPCIGWICGAGLAYVSLIEPFSRFVAKVLYSYNGEFPLIDTTITMQVLLGMLGLAGMRSWDKLNGTAK
jgi:hypothetical protein